MSKIRITECQNKRHGDIAAIILKIDYFNLNIITLFQIKIRRR